MSHRTVPLTLEQAMGLAGSNAHAISSETSFEVAQYLLQNKRLLNLNYRMLVEKVGLIVEWERLLKSAFGRPLSLEGIRMPMPVPLYGYHFVACVADVPLVELLNRCCHDIFAEVVISGSAFADEFGCSIDRSSRQAHKFLHNSLDQYTRPSGHITPHGVWICESFVTLNRNKKVTSQFDGPHSIDFSRAVTLYELLMDFVGSYMKAAREGKKDEWVPWIGRSRVWCAGSYGTTATKPGQLRFSPMVRCAGRTLFIECDYSYSEPVQTCYVQRLTYPV